jgi:hypothetical protein
MVVLLKGKAQRKTHGFYLQQFRDSLMLYNSAILGKYKGTEDFEAFVCQPIDQSQRHWL